MPYTLAHPGFSLFMLRSFKERVGTTGLVMGSIIPDTDILFRFSNSRFHIYQYKFYDVAFFIVPLALAAGFYFHWLLKPVLKDKLYLKPLNISEETLNFSVNDWFRKNYFKELLGVIVAVYLHLFIDKISHTDAWHTAYFFHFFLYPDPYLFNFYYLIGQYFLLIFFSFLGFYLLYDFFDKKGVSIRQWLEVLTGTIVNYWKFWSSFLLFSLLVFSAKFLKSGFEDKFLFDYAAIHFTSGILTAFFIFPVLFGVFTKQSLNNGSVNDGK